MKLQIVDYIGYCDENRNPIGHSLKTINEFAQCLKDKFEIEIVISKIYKPYIKDDIKCLQTNLFTCSKQSLIQKYINIFLKIVKIRNILKNKETKNIWFINSEFCLFFALSFLHIKKKHIYVTNYKNYLSGEGVKGTISKYIYVKALKKIRYIFTTEKTCSIDKHVYIPDYYFDNSLYEPFIKKKSDIVVCLGDMNNSKAIEELIEVFNENGVSLLIAGKFSLNEVYEKIKKIAKGNIQIQNAFLKKEEYYKILGSAKYCILPYKSKNYRERSSGVLLEAVFMGAIVIAPKFLLDYTEIEGLGYNNISELNNVFINVNEDINSKILSINKHKIVDYEKNTIVKKLCKVFNFEI